MSWLIIVFIVLSLIGSIAWVKPTPRQKFLAKLRLDARALGFNCRLVHITSPRPKGELEGQKQSIMAYRLFRESQGFEQQEEGFAWSIFSIESLATEGLPEGWSWNKGEGKLPAVSLSALTAVIEALPEGVASLDATSGYVTAYWNEKGDLDDLKVIKTQLMNLMEQGL